MITFLVNGIDESDLFYIVDEAIKDNANERSPVYIISTDGTLEYSVMIRNWASSIQVPRH